MTNKIPLEERISNLIDSFSTPYGSARVAVYSFPILQDKLPFNQFVKIFFPLLDRVNCHHAYAWSIDSNRNCINLILIVTGYFRNDVHDITVAVQRIWNSLSNVPIQFIADIPVTYETLAVDKERILNAFVCESIFPINQQRVLDYHCRSFAISRFY